MCNFPWHFKIRNQKHFTNCSEDYCVTSVKLPEYIHAPAGHSGEEARAEISRWVDRIATVQTHGHSDGHDDQADAQRLHALWSADIPPVSDGQDAQDQSSSGDYLENKTKQKTGS